MMTTQHIYWHENDYATVTDNNGHTDVVEKWVVTRSAELNMTVHQYLVQVQGMGG
jgi:hypothetical protein